MTNAGTRISEGIRDYYRSRLLWPLILLLTLIVIGIFTPVRSLLFPTDINQGVSLKDLEEYGVEYINVDIDNLYFTGYTSERFGKTVGYYYYTDWGDDYVFVLLSPAKCEQGNPMIGNIQVHGAIVHEGEDLDSLFKYLASDLNWTYDGISAKMSHYIISQPVAVGIPSYTMGVVYVFAWIFTVISLVGFLVFVSVPYTCPAIQSLRGYGNPKDILRDAENELLEFPQLVTEEVYITPNYFIVISHYGIALVPLAQIVWIYKHTPMKRFFGRFKKIEYALYVETENRHLIHCPRIRQTDLDGIIDYMMEANQNMLVGYTEENRQKVEVCK